MSLPDTIFIFVLALIIFGPKKLPEIGRQLGKLVGEFRRASNEFKFQIEEELRQADLMDTRERQKTIAPPAPEAVVESAQTEEVSGDPASNLPIGQHPNIESISTAELNPPPEEPTFNFSADETIYEPAGAEIAAANASASGSMVDETGPVITPAAGSEARTSVPFAPVKTETTTSTLPLPSQSEVTEAEITHG
jgi:sec-independent protein translocase protein TatB